MSNPRIRHSRNVFYFALFIGVLLLTHSGVGSVYADSPIAVHRINAGGNSITTSIGKFKYDNYFSSPSYKKTVSHPIAGTSDDVLYKTERWGTKTLNYNIPVANGKYKVVLHFAEIIYDLPGKRVFDVSLEGLKVLDNYDIVKKVGAYTAVIETFTVTVSDGVINLNLNSAAKVGGVNNPKISAIEVLPSTSNAPVVSSPIADQNCSEGALFNFAIPATCFIDPDGDLLNYSCSLPNGSAIPSWLSFNPATKTLTGTPPANSPGTLTVRVTVNDGNQGSVNDDFILNINRRPVGIIEVLELSEGQTFSFAPFSDPDNDSLSISYTLELPELGLFDVGNRPYWFTYNPSNQTFNGTFPTDFPSFDNYWFIVILTADDGKGGITDHYFPVFCDIINNPPVVIKPFPNIYAVKGMTQSTPSFQINEYFADYDARYVRYEFSISISTDDESSNWFSLVDNWLDYNFEMTPPVDAPDSIVVNVSGSDSWGASVSTSFVVYLADPQNAIVQNASDPKVTSTRKAAGEFDINSRLTASPNPFINHLNIEIASDQKEEYEVTVHDLLGRELSFNKLNSSQALSETISLDFSNTVTVSDSRIFLVTVENKTKTFRKVLRVMRN